MKKIIIIFVFNVIFINVFSQSPIIWSEDYTTDLLNDYSDFPTIKTDVDTITVIGRKNTVNGQRLLIVKYDLSGNILSTVAYGNDSVFNSILIDYKFDSTNHVYLLHKEQQLGFYKSKIVIQKYSLSGNLIWVEQIKNIADTSFTPHSLALANDSSLFVTAYKEFDYPEFGDDVISTTSISYLFAYSSIGSKLWQREFNPNTEISWFALDIFVHANTAFLFANNNSFYNCLVKVDMSNNITVNNNTGILNGFNDVQLTADSNLLITSQVWYRVSKINLSGSLIWTELYQTNLPYNVSGDEIKSIVQDIDGNIYITGRHYGLHYGTPSYTNADILSVKYNANGDFIWQNRYQYTGNNADIGNVIRLKNGSVYVGGESQQFGISSSDDYVVIKIDSVTGITNGVYRYDGALSGSDVVSSISVFDNGNVALTGLSYSNSKYNWTTQLIDDVVLSVQNFNIENNIEIFPNPFNSSALINYSIQEATNVEVYLTDMLGKKIVVFNNKQTKGKHSLELDAQRFQLAKGIYIIGIKTNRGEAKLKVVVQ